MQVRYGWEGSSHIQATPCQLHSHVMNIVYTFQNSQSLESGRVEIVCHSAIWFVCVHFIIFESKSTAIQLQYYAHLWLDYFVDLFVYVQFRRCWQSGKNVWHITNTDSLDGHARHQHVATYRPLSVTPTTMSTVLSYHRVPYVDHARVSVRCIHSTHSYTAPVMD